jgi:hypothetical protein
LYLLALALGQRGDKAGVFGRMIQEARIYFAAVLEECRIAGLDTSAIAEMLGKMNTELDDSIRPLQPCFTAFRRARARTILCCSSVRDASPAPVIGAGVSAALIRKRPGNGDSGPRQ